MIRILFAALLTAFVTTAGAQLTMTNVGVGGMGGGGGGCAQASSFITRANASTALNVAHTNAYTAMICGLVTDSVWNSLDALYIFATDTPTHGLLNLVSATFNASAVGGPVWTVDRGVTNNGGGADFIDTSFVPSAGGTNYVLNSGHLSVYDRTSSAVFSGAFDLGAFDAGTWAAINPMALRGINGLWPNINTNQSGAVFTNANGQGYYVISRTTSTNVNVRKYGAAPVTATDTVSTDGLPTCSIFFIGSKTCGGAGGSGTGSQLAAGSIGAGINTTQMDALSSRVNAYMTAVGANVY